MTQPTANDPTWRAVKELFLSALEQPQASQQHFIETADVDQSVRDQVQQLLCHHADDPCFLQPLLGNVAGSTTTSNESLVGIDVGGFHLQRVLGRGGMGTVYEAQQQIPYRSVALKILNVEIADQDLAHRMSREASILARLHHPGIAKIISSGTVVIENDFRPWFAMELIAGMPILDWVRNRQLNRKQCLELFLELCDAVQHAHHRNIIHRDLKPANILIDPGIADGSNSAARGQPVVLDFGIAKIVDHKPTQFDCTAAGQLLGTLAYMSPEQLTGDSRLVDARADVFALGIIGFEMLTGQLPHNRLGRSVFEVLQQVQHESPRPLRLVDPVLRGDIDIIFSKAIAADVDQRYQSVTELASDIRAYLDHRPIRARAPSIVYRVNKGLRRNRVLESGITATLIALAIGLFAYQRAASLATEMANKATVAAANSQYEADKAKAINEFISNDFLMRLLESIQAADSSPTPSVIDHASLAIDKISSMFAGRPNLEAAVRNEMGTIFYNLRAADQAAQQFELALRLWEANRGPLDVDTLKAVNNLGQTRMMQGQLELAEPLYRRALDGRLAVLTDQHPATLVSMNNFAQLLQHQKRFEESKTWLKHALDQQIKLLGKAHSDTLTTMFNYGSLLIQLEKVEEALEYHREAYEISKQTMGNNHVMTLHGATRLAQTMYRSKQFQPAQTLLLEALPAYENLFGTLHSETIVPRRLLARVYKANGDTMAAQSQLEIALKIARATASVQPQLVKQIQSELDRVMSK